MVIVIDDELSVANALRVVAQSLAEGSGEVALRSSRLRMSSAAWRIFQGRVRAVRLLSPRRERMTLMSGCCIIGS